MKAEPAPALEPAIKWEPSDSRRRNQQQEAEQQPTACVRSAKRRVVCARGGAGGLHACVEAREADAAAGYLQTEKMCDEADR